MTLRRPPGESVTVRVRPVPDMSVYNTLYRASVQLESTGSGDDGNPLDFRLERSRGGKCDVIAEVPRSDPGSGFTWRIEVKDKYGKVRSRLGCTRLFQKVFDVHVDGCRVQTSIFLFCFDDKRVNQVPEEDYSFVQHCLVTTSRHPLYCPAPISNYSIELLLMQLELD